MICKGDIHGCVVFSLLISAWCSAMLKRNCLCRDFHTFLSMLHLHTCDNRLRFLESKAY